MPTREDLALVVGNDTNEAVVSLEAIYELFAIQSPMGRNIMVKFIQAKPLPEWSLEGANKIMQRWLELAVGYRDQQFKKRIREKGLPMYETLERAAICEFDGGMLRWQAEAYALGELAEGGLS